MALAEAIAGARVTQGFGPPAASVASLEPAMWGETRRAYWRAYPGGTYHAHFHPAIDLAAPEGTPILAGESGKVDAINSNDPVNGNRIEIEIRPGVHYGHQHCRSFAPGMNIGSHVARGQVIAYVGHTGSATGAHSHYWVGILETGADHIQRTFLYDPRLFAPGGAMADDPRIRPLSLPATDLPLPEEDMDPTKLIPVGRATIAPGGTVYADPDRHAVLAASWPASTLHGVQIYALPIAETDPVTGRVALAPIRIDMKGGPEEDLRIGWIGANKVTVEGGSGYSQQQLNDAKKAARRGGIKDAAANAAATK